MNTIPAILLAILFNSYDKSVKYTIALHLLELLPQIPSLSLLEVANQCEVSVNTMNKFLKMIGYNNYNLFKDALLKYNTIRKQHLYTRMNQITKQDYQDHLAYSTNHTMDFEKFDEQVTLLLKEIAKAKRIIFNGALYTNAITLHIQEDFIIMDKATFNIQNLQKPLLPEFKEDDLMIVISNTGRAAVFLNQYFDTLTKKAPKLWFITGLHPQAKKLPNRIDLPIHEEREENNMILYEVLSYIRYRYYLEYYKR